jgi:hypothetical protein
MEKISFLIVFLFVLFILVMLKAMIYGIIFFIWLIKISFIALPIALIAYLGYKIKNRNR